MSQGTAVRVLRDFITPLGVTVPRGSLGRIVGGAHAAEAEERLCVAVVLARPSGPAVEVVVAALRSDVQVVEWFELAAAWPRDVVDARLIADTHSVVRVCWRCGRLHDLRYRRSPHMPLVSRDYECPRCQARHEEMDHFLGDPQATSKGE